MGWGWAMGPAISPGTYLFGKFHLPSLLAKCYDVLRQTTYMVIILFVYQKAIRNKLARSLAGLRLNQLQFVYTNCFVKQIQCVTQGPGQSGQHFAFDS